MIKLFIVCFFFFNLITCIPSVCCQHKLTSYSPLGLLRAPMHRSSSFVFWCSLMQTKP